MMIYGFSTKTLLANDILQACPQCGTMNLKAYASKKIFDFFRLFFLPYKTVYEIQCKHCESKYTLKQLGFNRKDINVKFSPSYQISLFLFPLLFFGILGGIFFSKIERQNI